jgi:hypothetical protein
MTTIVTKVRTYWALGIANIGRVVFYRARLKLGLFPDDSHVPVPASSVFFRQTDIDAVDAPAPTTWQSFGLLFDSIEFPVGDSAPDWLANPLNGKAFPNSERVWWKIPDFDPDVGDIKLIWELSRFGWALPFAQRARNGDYVSLDRLNSWMASWYKTNPPYHGPNWKCGQEASIRVMHLAMTALILGQNKSTEPALCSLIKQHLDRIRPTIGYASAQLNNHATSEAAALFIGGSWLAANGYPAAQAIADTGRAQLEQNVAKLVSPDGSFSQHSINYHRVMLDTISMCEIWRRAMLLEPFSVKLLSRAANAAEWLRHFIMAPDGDAPNLGANDGARLLPMGAFKYRDFRASCQRATALFAGKRAFDDRNLDYNNLWLNIETPLQTMSSAGSVQYSDGGYAILRKDEASAVLRFPRRRFRPSHCDALHMELWINGKAQLRDAGTFSYNEGDAWLDYFSGDRGHNIVQFDDKPQMPRLGRFLFGDWITANVEDELLETSSVVSFGAAYKNRRGCVHYRKLELFKDQLNVIDEIHGFENVAIMRWRLAPAKWMMTDHQVKNAEMTIEIIGEKQAIDISMHDGFESTHYMQKTTIPVLHVSTKKPGRIVTSFRWSS